MKRKAEEYESEGSESTDYEDDGSGSSDNDHASLDNGEGVKSSDSDEGSESSDNDEGETSKSNELNAQPGDLNLDNYEQPLPAEFADYQVPSESDESHNEEPRQRLQHLPAEFDDYAGSDSGLLNPRASPESDQSDGSSGFGLGNVVEPGKDSINIYERFDDQPDNFICELNIQNVVDYYSLAASVVDASPDPEVRNSDKRIWGNVLWPWTGFTIQYETTRNGTPVPLDPLSEPWEKFVSRLDQIRAKREVYNGYGDIPIDLFSFNGRLLPTHMRMRFATNFDALTKMIHCIFIAWWHGEENAEPIDLFTEHVIPPRRVVSEKCDIIFLDKGGKKIREPSVVRLSAELYDWKEESDGEDEGEDLDGELFDENNESDGAVVFDEESDGEDDTEEGEELDGDEEENVQNDSDFVGLSSEERRGLSSGEQKLFERYCANLGRVVIRHARL